MVSVSPPAPPHVSLTGSRWPRLWWCCGGGRRGAAGGLARCCPSRAPLGALPGWRGAARHRGASAPLTWVTRSVGGPMGLSLPGQGSAPTGDGANATFGGTGSPVPNPCGRTSTGTVPNHVTILKRCLERCLCCRSTGRCPRPPSPPVPGPPVPPHPPQPCTPYLALSWLALAPSGTFPLPAAVSSLSTLIHSVRGRGLSGVGGSHPRCPDPQGGGGGLTIEPLAGAQALGGHPDPHGAADVARLLAPVCQVGEELLRRAADHGLQGDDALPWGRQPGWGGVGGLYPRVTPTQDPPRAPSRGHSP